MRCHKVEPIHLQVTIKCQLSPDEAGYSEVDFFSLTFEVGPDSGLDLIESEQTFT